MPFPKASAGLAEAFWGLRFSDLLLIVNLFALFVSYCGWFSVFFGFRVRTSSEAHVQKDRVGFAETVRPIIIQFSFSTRFLPISREAAFCISTI